MNLRYDQRPGVPSDLEETSPADSGIVCEKGEDRWVWINDRGLLPIPTGAAV